MDGAKRNPCSLTHLISSLTGTSFSTSFVWPAPVAQFLALRYGKRTRRPNRKLIGIVVEPLRQAPIGQRVARGPA